MPFKRGFNPREKTCARCGEPFAMAPFRKFRLCSACRAASNLESSAASREARRRRKAKAGRKAPARNENGRVEPFRWRSRIPPEEALAALERACGPEMRAVTAAEYAAALGVGKSTAQGILKGLRILGLASARGRDLEEKPMGRLGTVRWVPRPREARSSKQMPKDAPAAEGLESSRGPGRKGR